MGLDTIIEWCDSTVNPTMGCDGCELAIPGRKENTCYTWHLHTTMKRAGKPGYAPEFFTLAEFPGRMAKAAQWPDLRGVDRPEKPWLNGRPRHIFISDMSDALSQSVGFDFLKWEIIDNVTSPAGRRHFWLWLTKRPARMRRFDQWLEGHGVAWPDNLMPMTSITSQQFVRRVHPLLKMRAKYRGLSCEPLLGQITLRIPDAEFGDGSMADLTDVPDGWNIYSFDWVIVGGESGQNARPMHPAWAGDLRDECVEASIPFFFKQWGDWAPIHALRANEPGIASRPWHTFDPDTSLCRVGKARAGHSLDGVTHRGMPFL